MPNAGLPVQSPGLNHKGRKLNKAIPPSKDPINKSPSLLSILSSCKTLWSSSDEEKFVGPRVVASGCVHIGIVMVCFGTTESAHDTFLFTVQNKELAMRKILITKFSNLMS